MIACVCTHPLDLAKVRLQTAAKPGQGLVLMVWHIIRDEGFFKIYLGLSASLLRQATYSTTRFGVYEWLKDEYIAYAHAQPTTMVLLPMLMTAGALGGLVGNPLDVVNIRMQNDRLLPADQRRNYRNVFDGFYRITKLEGVASLFRGLGPNLTRGVLMTASQVVTYDLAKDLLVKLKMDPAKKSTHFSASLLAGLVATTVCSPADVVKTRIMNAKGSKDSAVHILTNAVRQEGVSFMFRGWLPSFIRLGPHTIVTFLALEQLRKYRVGMRL